ncbi:hypothetical protein GCM10022255_001470 [Dactylosporangium darangshiense]|uniref:Uncharacterized protein n=1 Tax=Dactylosporangium darangshiense TaxID=579108 RepID=A0ABP8CTN9_9ACTN
MPGRQLRRRHLDVFAAAVRVRQLMDEQANGRVVGLDHEGFGAVFSCLRMAVRANSSAAASPTYDNVVAV